MAKSTQAEEKVKKTSSSRTRTASSSKTASKTSAASAKTAKPAKPAAKASAKPATKKTAVSKTTAAKTPAKKPSSSKTAAAKKNQTAAKNSPAKKAPAVKKAPVKTVAENNDVSKQIEQSNREIYELLVNNQTDIYNQRAAAVKKEETKKMVIRCAVLAAVLIAVILALILLAKGCSSSDKGTGERQNTIMLAKRYMEKGQLDPAMELLNKLLIQNADDQEVSDLLDQLIELKVKQERENAQNFIVNNTGGGSYDINLDTDSITNAFKDSLDSMSRELNAANEASAKNQEQLNRLLEAQRQGEKERQAETKALAEQKKAEESKRKAEEAELAKQNEKLQNEIKKINELIELGNASLNTGNSGDAIKKYQEACKNLPISQGEPKFSASKYSEIASNLYDAAEKEKNPETKAMLMQQAVSYANKAIEKDPSNAKAHFILAMNAENNKDSSTAEKELELAVKNDPNNYLYYYYLGRRQQINKKYSQARSSYNSSIKLNSNFDSSHFNLGLTCNKLNLQKEALASFRKAYAVNPQHAKAYLEEARLLRRGFNDLEGAINVYNKVLTIEPDNMAALKECGSVYAETANYVKAENCFRRVVAKLGTTQDPMTYYNLSTVLYNQSKVTDALKYAVEAYDTKDILKKPAEKAMIVYQYALCTEKNGDKTKAIGLYREVLTLNPSHTYAKINLGIMFMEMNPPDVDTALSFLTGAYQENKNNFEVNNNLGNAYLLKKDYKSAVNYYLNASKLKPKDAEVKINLAKAYTESGEFDNAKIIYMDVINMNPNSYDSYIDLAKVCIALNDTISAEGYLTALQNKKPEYRTSEVKALLDTVRPKN